MEGVRARVDLKVLTFCADSHDYEYPADSTRHPSTACASFCILPHFFRFHILTLDRHTARVVVVLPRVALSSMLHHPHR